MKDDDHHSELARWYVFVTGAPTSITLIAALTLGNLGYSWLAIQFVWGATIMIVMMTVAFCLWLS